MTRLGIVPATILLIAQAPPPPTDTPPPVVQAPAWLPRGTADLVILDKVSTKLSPLSVKVGEAARFGPLTIGVRHCFVRPPDVAADATTFLDVTDSTPGIAEFHGWMVLSAPAVSAMQHPVYDVRLVACR